MRVHDDLLNSVAFIAETADGVHRLLGTGFFLGLITTSPDGEDSHHYYFITAKHCLRGATNVERRLNKLEGGTTLVQIEHPWFISETADVAAIHLAPSHKTFSYLPIDSGIALTDTTIAQHKIGIGDEVMTVGLLFQREGQHRNLPIVRTGIISAMPSELIRGENSGEYAAYLVEARSTHGLSGSPVFVVLEPGRVVPDKVTNINNPVAQAIAKHRITFLLGIVRGFYPASMEEIPLEITEEMLEAINTGITAVTPIQEAITLLNRDDVSSERHARDVERLPRRGRRTRSSRSSSRKKK